jgi:hypothetical protein
LDKAEILPVGVAIDPLGRTHHVKKINLPNEIKEQAVNHKLSRDLLYDDSEDFDTSDFF